MLSKDIRSTEINMHTWRFGVVLDADHSAAVASTLKDLKDRAETLEIAALPNGGGSRLNATCVSEPLDAMRETFAAMAHDRHQLSPAAVKQFRHILTTAGDDAERLEGFTARRNLPRGVIDFTKLRNHPGRLTGYACQPGMTQPDNGGPGAVA